MSHPVPLWLSTLEDITVTGSRDFQRMKNDIEKYVTGKGHGNDIIAKVILAGSYGHRAAIVFRDWVRSRMNPEEELPDGGSGQDTYEFV